MCIENSQRPTFARINLDSLSFNLRSVRRFIGDDVRCLAVVKANAYGHGAVECSRRLAADGVDWLGVALPEEGIELRSAGIDVPILVLGSFFPGQEGDLLNLGLTPVIYTLEQASLLNAAAIKAGKRAEYHVKIDTGMGRIGVRFDRLDEFASGLAKFENICLDGVMTHFAAADDLDQNDFTNDQIRRFDRAVETIHQLGFTPSFIDMANSPGAIAHPDSRRKLVRLGGVLYGLGGDVLPSGIDTPSLRPVLSLKSSIAYIKKVPNGETIGYGRTFRTDRDSLIATIPIGYADGYPRSLSNLGSVLIKGLKVPVVGRISMDWTIIDVTDVHDPSIGDEVTLIGPDGNCEIRSEHLAAQSDTISYEITCGLSSRVPRVFSPMLRDE
ncbi:MAG: alanine racemase [Acidobacteriota bacterium]